MENIITRSRELPWELQWLSISKNIFMSKFVKHMIRDFFELYGKKPIIWLRYIDGIFFIWNDREESLKLFINFCNGYAADNKMKSSIKFTVDYSKSEVVFLDTKIKLTDDKVVTTLFCKPSASHQFLHRSSYHPTHVFSCIAKSKFIRIRHICTNLTGYWDNASKFVSYFQLRGFNVRSLNKIVRQVAETSRTSLIEKNSIPQVLEMPENNRVPFVVTWHHKLSALPKILHRNYETMIKKFPELKCIFPQPPAVAFRRNRNLEN